MGKYYNCCVRRFVFVAESYSEMQDWVEALTDQGAVFADMRCNWHICIYVVHIFMLSFVYIVHIFVSIIETRYHQNEIQQHKKTKQR